MGKRTKQYKKLMRSFEFLGFRTPYQLLITSDVILDTLKLDVVHLFEKTLSTKEIKPMITQCCIRALYEQNKPGPNRNPAVAEAIERAKTFERRRCGHLMDEAPLSEYECMMSVVDPKGKGENKFRYVVVTQDEELRERLRSVVPTPLMYVRRSVMILEPMSAASARVREREERVKFTDGIVRQNQNQKRKWDDEDNGSDDDSSGDEAEGGAAVDDDKKKKKKKKSYGPKGPNPLAIKKAKKTPTAEGEKKERPRKAAEPQDETPGEAEAKAKRKRRKKNKATGDGGESADQAGPDGDAVMTGGDDAQG
ncbi:rRNA-processing protein utp23 [Rhypophila sp. PSN 637]